MKKVTTLFLALVFALGANAQGDNTGDNTNQTQQKSNDDNSRLYRSWAIGADFGWSMLLGDMYFLEANQEDYNSDFGGFDPGFTVNLQKWYSSAWGWRGRAGILSYSGSNGIYGTNTKSSMRGEIEIMLNLSGIGTRNRRNTRKDAWIVHTGFGYSWANTIVYKYGQEFLKLGADQYPQFISQSEKDENIHNTVYMPFGLEWRYRFAERWDFKLALDANWALDDELDGSAITLQEDATPIGNTPEYRNLQFANTTNDFLVYLNLGVNYYFSWFKPHEDPTPIIYMDPGKDPRVDDLVDKMGKLLTDKDDDGVSDYFDKEPDTPEGYKVYGGGQAVDQDGDGVPDGADEDPFSTPGEKVDANGRELDDDGDGVPNGRDEEPNTKPGSMVNFQGKEISGNDDNSASEAFIPNIYFDFDKSNITSANYQRLAVIARFLQNNPGVNLIAVGHTDKVGSEAYNQGLSERRAIAAKRALVDEFGIDPSRIEMDWKGKTQLVSKRGDINRRVEFHIAR